MKLRNWYDRYREEHIEGADGGGGTGGDAGGASTGIDIDATVDGFAAELGLKGDAPAGDAISSSGDAGEGGASGKDDKGALSSTTQQDDAAKAEADRVAAAAATTVQVKAPPKAWAAEQHPLWAKIPPEAQTYIEQREAQIEAGFKAYAPLKEVGDKLAPFTDYFKERGVAPAQAVDHLLRLEYALTKGPAEQRLPLMRQLLTDLKIDPKTLAEAAATTDEPTYQDPATKVLNDRLSKLETERTEEATRAYQAKAKELDTEVTAFAKDPAHPHFDLVAGDIALLLAADKSLTLAQAYDKAVYAHPVTRQKEMDRIQKETEDRLRKEAEEAAKKARGARGANRDGNDAGKRPQDVTGTIDDTLTDTLKNIKARDAG